MTFRIVPKGTEGAIPLQDAMEIMLDRLGLRYHDRKTRERLSVATKRSWRRGVYEDTQEKQSETMRRRYGYGEASRGRRE